MGFSKSEINIAPERVTESIVRQLREIASKKFHKRGAALGVSGGIDSSVCLALAAKAFDPKRVLAIAMPEEDSNPESQLLARQLAKQFGTEFTIENLTPALSGFGTYQRRDEAIKNVFPEFDSTYKSKIVLPTNLLEKETLNVYYLTIISPSGEEKSKRIPLKEYLQIVAASNFKQRSRMAMVYYHAERLNYMVIGTGNKNEHDQGFFVKWGDGGTDVKPIAHLYKTQVYQLGEYLGIPDKILKRVPTTDTYSAECTQDEFFFRVSYQISDVICHGMEKKAPLEEIASELNMSEEQVIRIYNDVKQKIRTTEYLKTNPLHLT